jgi:hypothetical protein
MPLRGNARCSHGDSDEQVRYGVIQLAAMLAGINPILRPAQND